MHATARTRLAKFAHDQFNIAWPVLLIGGIGGPLYYLATLWLDSSQMTALDQGISLTAWVIIKASALLFGTIMAFGLVTIMMVLRTGVRTVKQVVPLFLGCVFFAFLYCLALTA